MPDVRPFSALIERMHAVLRDPERYDEDEPRPVTEVTMRMEHILRWSDRKGRPGWSDGAEFGTFYGEISCSWTHENSMVRVASLRENDSDKKMHLMWGRWRTYQHKYNPDHLDLLAALEWMRSGEPMTKEESHA